MSEVSTSLSKRVFLYFLIAFNVLFLTYVFTVGYYNRLALNDFGCLWAVKNYGFFNPFKYWYFNWQGRFGPQFFLTVMFLFYEATSSLLFYPILLSSLFVYSIYQILNFYFSLSKLVLLNYSILLFSALLLTTFELSTFYWMNASVMYFGGIVFALLGLVFILKAWHGLLRYVVIAFCFLYAGSSSEHVGALGCFLLFLLLVYTFFKTAYNSSDFISHFRNFISPSVTKGLLMALLFCSVAFIVMILAPGTKVRMSQTQNVTNPIDLLNKSFECTIFVCAHIFFKLPYIIAFIPSFLLFGTYFKSSKIPFRKNLVYVLVLCSVAMLSLIFVSNLPMAYALGTFGPLRSYVYVSFFLVAILFSFCVYAGFHYQSRLKSLGNISIISLAMLFAFVFYTFYSELPLLKKYNETDKKRITIINEHKKNNRKEPVFIPPLFNPEYITITDMWRTLTHTDKVPSPMTDVPVLVGEISETPDWRNDQLKLGLGLKFEVYLDPKSEPVELK